MTPSAPVRHWLATLLGTPQTADDLGEPLSARHSQQALGVARRLAIAPSVADVLSRLRAWHALTPDVADEWQSCALETMLHNVILLRDAATLQQQLEANGIRCLFIKGTALLQTTHANPGARHLDDIDVVVDQPERAARILIDLGYEQAERFDGMALDGRTLAEWNRDDHHAERGLISPDGTAVDLHRRIPGLSPRREALVWENAERHGSAGLWVPSYQDQFDIVAAHIVVHHLSSPRYWARHVADIAALRAASPSLSPSTSAGRVSCTVADAVALRQPRALSLVFPSTDVAARGDRVLHAIETAQRVGSDLARNPSRLRHKLLPAPAYMRYRYGNQAAGAQLARLYVRRVLRGDFFEETA
ncbi:MAG: hypothetical protein ACI81R_002535 [Bradymonadia bacterium]|jgi:hypothetical protein